MNCYYIDIGYACFSIDVDSNGICYAAAPIAKWMAGKSIEEIHQLVSTKGGNIQAIIM